MNLSQKAISKSKIIVHDITWNLGLDTDWLRNPRGQRIAVYHGVVNKVYNQFEPIYLSINTFESHLKFYKKYFNIISIEDYYHGNFSKDKFNLCISFDDGYANNFEYVLPLLEKYQIPATFFITGIRDAGYDILWNDFLRMAGKYGPSRLDLQGETYHKNKNWKYINLSNRMPLRNVLRNSGFDLKKQFIEEVKSLLPDYWKDEKDYWLQMTEEQIKTMCLSPWVNFGSHGYYHNDLTKTSANEAFEELKASKKYIETLIQKEVKAIAFPYGTYNHEIIRLSEKAGYSQLLALDFNSKSDRDILSLKERMVIDPNISVNNQARAFVNGKYA